MEAAVVSLRILASIRYQSQLQTYLAFDVTAAFSSAVVIALMTFISTKPIDETKHVEEALQMLKDLSRQGNISAKKRASELEKLNQDIKTIMNSDATGLAGGSMPDALVPDANPGNPIFAAVDGWNMNSLPGHYSSNDHYQGIYPFDLGQDDLSTTSNLDEDLTEGFQAFFSQTEQYPEVISWQVDPFFQ